MSSMHILVQRYLDGELNDVERAAFLEDVAGDPRVAELLEKEARLDMAIVHDAFTLEPPAHLRSAVLNAVAANAPTPSGIGLRSTARMVVAGLLLLTVAVNRADMMDEARFVTAPVAAATAATATSTIASTTTTYAGSAVPAKTVSGTSDGLSVTTSPVSSRPAASTLPHTVPVDVPREAASSASPTAIGAAATISDMLDVSAVPVTPWVEGWNTASVARMDGVPSGVFIPYGVGMSDRLSAILASSGACLRYRVAGKDEPFFVETGLLVARMTSSVYTNGVERQDVRQRNLPFVLVGLEGPLGLSVFDRVVHGSVAIGMASVGPLLVADASVPLVNMGHTAIDAGVRIIGAADLRRNSAVLVIPQPFLRLSLGL